MAAPQIGEETKVTLDLKTIGMIVGFVITIAGMWFGLQSDIAEAKEYHQTLQMIEDETNKKSLDDVINE